MSKRPWIQTFSGQDVDGEFDYEHPEMFTWPVESIAHHLAMICRYTGAPKKFYSVAEHCARVALYAADTVRAYRKDLSAEALTLEAKGAARAGLVHDVTEMVMGDVNSPLKNMPYMAGYKKAEEALHVHVAKRFNTHKVFVEYKGLKYDAVRNADLQALEFERKALLGKPPRPWEPMNLLPVVPSQAFAGELGLSWEEAESNYLDLAQILDVK